MISTNPNMSVEEIESRISTMEGSLRARPPRIRPEDEQYADPKKVEESRFNDQISAQIQTALTEARKNLGLARGKLRQAALDTAPEATAN